MQAGRSHVSHRERQSGDISIRLTQLGPAVEEKTLILGTQVALCPDTFLSVFAWQEQGIGFISTE